MRRLSSSSSSAGEKALLEVKQVVPSGAVRVRVNVGELTAGATGNVLSEWQSTSDGGASWTDLRAMRAGRDRGPKEAHHPTVGSV